MNKPDLDDDWLAEQLAETSIEDDGFTNRVMSHISQPAAREFKWFVPLCFVLSFACFVVFVFLLAGVEHQAQPFAEIKRQELLAMFSVLVTVLLIWLSENIEVFN